MNCNIELCLGKISYVAADYISYMAPDPYHLSIQDEETRQEGTLMGHKERLRCPIVSKEKAGRLTKDCTR